ncbi:MAG: acyltransferase [Bacteroidales bacterium]|nr:acyltransferase [Bacteroidales bacterium]
MNSFYSKEELLSIGFKTVGENVLISRKASFYSPSEIEIGNHVRIDDFCILSGKIKLGNYIHISAQCALYGQAGITMEDFTGLSPGTIVFSATDDFSGEYLIGPMVPHSFRHVIEGHVFIKRFVQVGARSVILPGVILEEGCAVGAMSLITQSLEAWKIYAGIPARFIKERSRRMSELTTLLLSNSL